MEVTTLRGDRRTAVGTNQVARLRQAGKVPAIVYGGGGEATSVELDFVDVEREMRQHHRVFNLDVGGKVDGVYLQEVQWDILTDEALHLDFRRIDLNKPLRIEVEIIFVGHPKGGSRGGNLVKDRTHITVDALPAAVPEEIEVPIAEVDLGDRILARELKLPVGVTLPEGAGDELLCHMPGDVDGPAPEEADEPTDGEAS